MTRHWGTFTAHAHVIGLGYQLHDGAGRFRRLPLVHLTRTTAHDHDATRAPQCDEKTRRDDIVPIAGIYEATIIIIIIDNKSS